MIQFKKENITVFQSSLYMTTTAIIEDRDVVIMTDPNWLPNEVREIRNYITSIIGKRELYIIYTHSDFDHIIGSGAFPEAKVIASKQFDSNPNKEEIMKQIHMFDQGYYLKREYKPEYPKVDIVITEDGQSIQLGSLTLNFYYAPGHTDDSLFTLIEPYGLFLAGDYLSDVEFPFIFSSYTDYVHTVKKAEELVQRYSIKTLIPGHGNTADNPEKINNRIHSAKFYLNELLRDNNELESYLTKEYTFFDGMKSIHTENKKIANRKEEKN